MDKTMGGTYIYKVPHNDKQSYFICRLNSFKFEQTS